MSAIKATDMKIVTSDLPRPVAAPSTWRTWVLLLERSDAETEPGPPATDRDEDLA
jgi:hypothetical protein